MRYKQGSPNSGGIAARVDHWPAGHRHARHLTAPYDLKPDFSVVVATRWLPTPKRKKARREPGFLTC